MGVEANNCNSDQVTGFISGFKTQGEHFHTNALEVPVAFNTFEVQ